MADEKKKANKDDAAICKQALERYQRGIEREQENIDAAYEDLRFSAGEQWSAEDLDLRKGRPVLTVNRLPQFIRQVTGDMRQMKPSIKVVPVDSRGDKDTAETIAGIIRYIENRSDAGAIYMSGADSQVRCGIGHLQVTTEYAADSTFDQEIRILGVDDGVSVVWDPDATLPSKEDAKWCIVPHDMSRESFKEAYPEFSVEEFDDADKSTSVGWFDNDMVRVAAYWVKKPVKKLLALLPDGGVVDLTDKFSDKVAKQISAGKPVEFDPGIDDDVKITLSQAKKVEQRDGFKVCRYLITAAHVLETTEWAGMHIPVVPVIGEEVRIGRKTVRHGLIRFARDPQKLYNYYSSTDAEVIALQPKAPFIGTEKNVEKYQDMWATANNKAHPVLIYTPDAANGGQAPQRVQPPVSSQGINEGLLRSVDDMKAVIGIYDASLGQRSNETSGKAIMARQREGDTGSFVYVDNWTRAIKRCGTIIADLIPHVYDTERMIRIMGDDGKVDLKWINRATGLGEIDPNTGEPLEQQIENDVTVGAYDIVMDSGPSFTTKRQEARESMTAFIQSAPDTAPVILDLIAKAQDWPLADEIAKRLEAMAPPPVQKLIAKQKKESGEEEQPDPPTQGEIEQQQVQQAAIQLELQNKSLANAKLQAETDKIRSETQVREVEAVHSMQPEQPEQQGPDPTQMMQMQLDAEQMQMKREHMQFEFAHKQRMAELEFQDRRRESATKLNEADMTEGDVDSAENGTPPSERRHGEQLQAMQFLAQSFQAGMEAIADAMKLQAQAIAAPRKVDVQRLNGPNSPIVGGTSQLVN